MQVYILNQFLQYMILSSQKRVYTINFKYMLLNSTELWLIFTLSIGQKINPFKNHSVINQIRRRMQLYIDDQTSCSSKSMTVVKTQFWKRCPLKCSGQEDPNLRDPLWRASFRYETNHQLAYFLTYLLHGAEFFLKS